MSADCTNFLEYPETSALHSARWWPFMRNALPGMSQRSQAVHLNTGIDNTAQLLKFAELQSVVRCAWHNTEQGFAMQRRVLTVSP